MGDGIQVAKLEEKELRLSEDEVSHLALDIGGSLIKMVYFSSSSSCSSDDQENGFIRDGTNGSSGNLEYRINSFGWSGTTVGKKTEGGGAFKFADLFKEKLGIILDKEITLPPSLLKVIKHSSLWKNVSNEWQCTVKPLPIWTVKNYVQIDHKDLYPYLLVNVGSGVSMIKVDGDNEFERVSGTSVGGGTFWGLGKLLTKCKSFDELLELSHQGNNRVIDMLVGDIYGGTGYSKIGLTSTTIASSFGKAVSENKELEDYRTEDVARSLLRMISNNIGQIAYLNALRFGLKRIFFGGFFIRQSDEAFHTIFLFRTTYSYLTPELSFGFRLRLPSQAIKYTAT
ncbi:Pantothenate kinase [Sesamum angolense]|uniref:pantothenate kinase n=1 Tax=Sesamum angolense TaxID=2727404 RepID=A0AAE2BYV6_9LAMI|nr:Pantothenate kinase [Sesamum angolense]